MQIRSRSWNASLRCLFLLVVVFGASVAARAADQPRIVFGQERFTRKTGKPLAETRTFSVAPHVKAPYTLEIINGNPGAGSSIPDAVSSATLSLDGHEIVSENEFSKTTPSISKEITLATGNHTLEVVLKSAPDSYIRVTISGIIRLSNLAQARSGHSATLLADGSALIAGGTAASQVLGTAERFDATTLKSTALSATLAAPRSDHAAALLPQRDALLTGGADAAGPLPTAELFRASNGTFATIGTAVPIARSGHSATLMLNGTVLILGGKNIAGATLSQTEAFDPNQDPLTGALYNPATGSFRLLPNALNLSRSNHAATLLPNGQVLITGGRNDSGLLASAELFDPATGRSTLLSASLNTPRSEHSAALRPDGAVIIAGGIGSAGLLSSIEVYAPQTQTFTASSAKLSVARRNHSATLLPIGETLIAGGEGASGTLAHTELIGPPGSDNQENGNNQQQGGGVTLNATSR